MPNYIYSIHSKLIHAQLLKQYNKTRDVTRISVTQCHHPHPCASFACAENLPSVSKACTPPSKSRFMKDHWLD
ncbi:predicted protein [Sclerotinia sclerotiorum 1980 UF-70]|uniref:Uncharacterized protein n=1 Tax=Sclerotinia sclerotiorum (strain ATCC 18683 / 1980 / Ss-1) TaxID=665079 RepID=A7EY88_SCLS1|nr:predicted protein [Sclerotinia sclerotiorum 1980 UF-70]EDN94430.1 predicted protein [Sclerotinia sclerotiorum 1980 UF-70]